MAFCIFNAEQIMRQVNMFVTRSGKACNWKEGYFDG